MAVMPPVLMAVTTVRSWLPSGSSVMQSFMASVKLGRGGSEVVRICLRWSSLIQERKISYLACAK